MSSDTTAAVIIIGNEILSGRTQDSNLAFIGKHLDLLGIRLAEARIIPDVEQVIIDTVNEFRNVYTYVITTGGIGPTHDDITAQSIAKAFRLQLERRSDAVERLEKYYGPDRINDARLKMADIPSGAVLIDNPISGAPGFQLENVFVMAGVPTIMQLMFEGIEDRLTGSAPILTSSVATNLGESSLAEDLGKLQQAYPDINIGSYPYFKKGKLGVNVVMRTTDSNRLIELNDQVCKMILRLGGKVLEEHV